MAHERNNEIRWTFAAKLPDLQNAAFFAAFPD